MLWAWRNILVILSLGTLAALGPATTGRGDNAPALAGTWRWSWTDRNGKTHQHVLEVEGANTELAAREQFDDLPPVRVSKLSLAGKNLRFTVVRGDHRTEYSGVVADADTINGTVKVRDKAQAQDQSGSDEFVWKAKRQTHPPLPPRPDPKKPEQ